MPTRPVSNGQTGPGAIARADEKALDLRKVEPEILEKASRPRPEPLGPLSGTGSSSWTGAGAGATGRGGSQREVPLLHRGWRGMIRRRRRARSVVSDSGELRPGHWGAKSPRKGEVAGTVRRREEREDEGENDFQEGGRASF